MALTPPDELVKQVAEALRRVSGMPRVFEDTREQAGPPFVEVHYAGAQLDADFPNDDPANTAREYAYIATHTIGVGLITEAEGPRGGRETKLDKLIALVLPVATTLHETDNRKQWSWSTIDRVVEDGAAEKPPRSIVLLLTAIERERI